ncbi:MAG TPA: NAD-glutamate dehydrogenase [Gammaproteobacteria bacterium]|nr:NAD-glutamate dehydrogenase [Gammaproteobacteria bacterium]
MAARKTDAQQRDDILSRIYAAANARKSDHDHAFLKEYLHSYYGEASTGDLREYTPGNLAAAALSHLELGEHLGSKAFAVRVLNPRPKEDGWHSVHTVFQTVVADMPFLVDSTTMVAQKHGLTVHQTIHPVLAVRRDAEGRIEAIGPRGSLDGARDESFIHLEVDCVSGSERLERLRHDLELALADASTAFADWTAMRQQAEALAYKMDPESSPLEPEELEEGRNFLHWLVDNRFVFLGFREYRLERQNQRDVLCVVPKSGLGILREEVDRRGTQPLVLSGEARKRALTKELVIITKANSRSTVHRLAYLDYIGFKLFDANGEVCGEARFLGLFTSQVYAHSPREIPIVRRKIQQVLTRSRLAPTSHAGKGLVQALETLPRDELFQASEEELFTLASGILDIQERLRVRVFTRRDAFGRFYSCLIYVPRERYDAEVQQRIETIIAEAFEAREIETFVQMGESLLARVHIIAHTKAWQRARFGEKRLEQELSEATRNWDDRLQLALRKRYGEDRGQALADRWCGHFPLGYQADVAAEQAVHDVRLMQRLGGARPLELKLYRSGDDAPDVLRMKVFSPEQPLIASDILPLLENMGLKIISERPYEIELGDASIYWVHDFYTLIRAGTSPDLGEIGPRFREAFLALWGQEAENDDLNALILSAGLDWREVRIIRAYAKYLLQTGMPFGEGYLERAVAARPATARALVRYFEIRFDPQAEEAGRKERMEQAGAALDRELESLSSQDEDRILRGMAATMRATLRTNHFRRDGRGRPRHFLSFKLDSAGVPELPLPRPLYEIFVYAPHVEGIHLRGGKVARGGIRWSDRRADFRTEVLGLMKAQMVKNTVIVPVGCKGGFIVKQPPATGNRDAVLTEVKRCYRDFIRGLLDITDNLDANRVVPPPQVLRYDEDDPYFVVAADKGTATFSDLANEIAADYDFWLGDAFASGGSVGYDHKKLGITAKGAWESVKRLFRETGVNPETAEITAVGIGDMSGDVFGNGMLRSRTIRLVAAFNHLHIFIDPNPDAAASFRERERLFELPRSGWNDYDPKAISRGGGVFDRSAKSIRLSREAQEALAITGASLTPQELIRAILKAPVDLLWNGGIGTYVKSSRESQADAGDRSNDAVRVDGKDLRCKLVGEGGNLGFTQLGRIEFARHGGRITTDFIDNSAGVDCSDHEVNIKILLNLALQRRSLREEERRELLVSMTDQVEHLVLRDNYLQSLALSVAEAQSQQNLNEHAHLIRALERQGTLNRQIEYLPSDEELAERRVSQSGLTRPELAVLLAYGKIAVYNALERAPLAGDPYLRRELADYFPTQLRERYTELMPEHPLQGDIIATEITNSMINRMGPNFPFRIQEQAGVGMNQVARAYTISRESLNVLDLWRGIEALGSDLPGQVQSSVILATGHLISHATRWVIEHGYATAAIGETVAAFGAVTRELHANLPDILPQELAARYEELRKEYADCGLSNPLARRVAALPALYAALDIAEVVRATHLGVADAGRAYFRLGAELGLDWLRGQVDTLPTDDHWKALARATLREGLYAQQRRLSISALNGKAATPMVDTDARIDAWLERESANVERFRAMWTEIRATNQTEFASMSVALQKLVSLARSMGGERS